VLSVDVVNKTQGCLGEKEVAVINGTTPGPELRLRVGKTYWIRVYNDMATQNLTMVCCFFCYSFVIWGVLSFWGILWATLVLGAKVELFSFDTRVKSLIWVDMK